MPKVAKALTITEVQAAKPKDKEYNLADGKGLYLRVKTNGTKLWIYNYLRPHSKKRANISFGCYPVVTLSEAREARIVRLERREEMLWCYLRRVLTHKYIGMSTTVN